MKMTPGKLKGMKAVADGRGVIAAAAMDQRGSLKKALAKEKGADVGDAMMEEFMSLVTEVLTGGPRRWLARRGARLNGVRPGGGALDRRCRTIRRQASRSATPCGLRRTRSARATAAPRRCAVVV